jgi:hypothetical protein
VARRSLGTTIQLRTAVQQVGRLPRVPTVPVFSAMVVGRTGELWVREYRLPADTADVDRWAVFAPTGQRTATAHLPAGLEPRYIDRGHAIGIVTDELGVEYVVAYRFPDQQDS